MDTPEAQSLAESEARYRSLVEATGDMVWATSPDGKTRLDVVAWRAFTGQTLEDMTTQGWAGAIHPDDRDEATTRWQEALARGTRYVAEYRVRKYDGTYEYFLARGIPVRAPDGTIREWVGTIRNVNARRVAQAERARALAAEQAARAEAEAAQARLLFLAEASSAISSSLDYRTVLQTLAEVVVPYLADGCVLSLLREDGTLAIEAVAGVTTAYQADLETMAHQYPQALDSPHGTPAVIRTGRSILYPAMTPTQVEGWGMNDGHRALLRRLDFRSSLAVPLLAGGRAFGALTLLRSQPDRPYSRADLTLAEDLARRVALAVENARLYEAAQEAILMREEFLAVASHELRTPLTGLQMQVQMLQRFLDQDRLGTLPPERLSGMLAMAERQVKGLTRLVNSLLDVSRLGTGQLELDPEELDLAVLVRETLDGLRPEMEALRSKLYLEADTPVVGLFDRDRMVQVITNLVGNAMKYGRGQPVTVRCLAEGRVARLVVADQGIGIPADQLDRIFDRFARAVPLENYGGLGLGLYIVRQIVQAAGGDIRVTSAPGAGAQFEVTLPCRPT